MTRQFKGCYVLFGLAFHYWQKDPMLQPLETDSPGLVSTTSEGVKADGIKMGTSLAASGRPVGALQTFKNFPA